MRFIAIVQKIRSLALQHRAYWPDKDVRELVRTRALDGLTLDEVREIALEYLESLACDDSEPTPEAEPPAPKRRKGA